VIVDLSPCTSKQPLALCCLNNKIPSISVPLIMANFAKLKLASDEKISKEEKD